MPVGNVIGGITTRRGTIVDNEVRDDDFTLSAVVPLNDMFGYSSQLRGSTQGKGEFSMEYKVRLFVCSRYVDMKRYLIEPYAGASKRSERAGRSL